ncbi:MAG TPA: VWA domain-containing protein, partial [Chloroflexota bacterium]
MDHLADKILDEQDLRSALRELLQRGADFQSGRHMPGLRDLLEQLRQRRQQQLQRYNLGSTVDDIKERLERVVDTERAGIQRRLDEASAEDDQLQKLLENMAQKHLRQLDQLPEGVGGKMQALRDYEFMDGEARQQFEELLNELKEQMLQQYFQGLKQSLGAMTPELMSQLQQMVKELNELLEQHRRGDNSGFQEFMDKWGQFFP